MNQELLRIGLVTLLSWVIVTSGGVEAQQPLGVRDELVALSVRLAVRGPVYASADQEVRILYTTDALPVIVEIGNNTNDMVVIGRRSKWSDSVSFVMERLSGHVDGRASRVSLVRRAVGVPNDRPTGLEPGRVATTRLEVQPPDAKSLEPGRYKLMVSLDPEALGARARQLRNILTRDVLFEVREPRTAVEVLDYHLQRAHRADAESDFLQSRQWAEKALALKPDSLAAKVDIAVSWLRERNCARAEPLLEHAITAINSGADPELRLSDVNREDWAAGLRSVLAAQCAR